MRSTYTVRRPAALGNFCGGDLRGGGTSPPQLGVGPQEVRSATTVTATEADRVNGAAEDAAAPEFWALALPLAASLLGGLIGSKVWPRLADSDPGAVRVRS